MSKKLAGRLLVIDFDFFFEDPYLTPNATDERLMLHDWSHREDHFFNRDVWYMRAAAFLSRGKQLPRTLPHDGFWDRFNIDLDHVGLAGDSNLYAGQIFPDFAEIDADGWEEVWLFDAHHDSGYKKGRSLADFAENGMSCENWMLNHAERGSKLHVRYPAWRGDENGALCDVEPPPAVVVDREVDDGRTHVEPFDLVYVCRSGSWVPSWCDVDFEHFIADAPTGAEWIDDCFPRERKWSEEMLSVYTKQWTTQAAAAIAAAQSEEQHRARSSRDDVFRYNRA